VTEACSFSTLPESTQNVRLTSEARPASAGWRDACWLGGIFSFLITFLFSRLLLSFGHWSPARSVTKRKSGSSGCYTEKWIYYFPTCLLASFPETHQRLLENGRFFQYIVLLF
jgi:hypothetical protein